MHSTAIVVAVLVVTFGHIKALEDIDEKYKAEVFHTPPKTSASDYDCKGVKIVQRKEWGAREPRDVAYFRVKKGVRFVFFHHTTGSECWFRFTCARRARQWQNFHMDTKGWDDMGYSFLIGGDGRVYVGRGWNGKGAHTRGYNHRSIGISFIGDFTWKVPGDHMKEAANKLIQCGIEKGKINKNYSLHGHRDANCTACPGDAFYRFMRTMPHFKGKLKQFVC